MELLQLQSSSLQEISLVHQFLEIQAKKTPASIAVKDWRHTISYEGLNSRANCLARFLQSLGVGRDKIVGIFVERSIDLIVAVLAVLKAGGAYLPLDPDYPRERLGYMIDQAQVSFIITHAHLLSQIPVQSQTSICLDTQWSEIASFSTENPKSTATADSLGYVIYTSGSSGHPKGVALPHCALVKLIFWQANESAVTTGKTLQFTPISFDVSFQEIMSTLAVGGTLVMISDENRRDSYLLLKVLEEESVERLFLPFIALQYLAEVAAKERKRPLKLREVITAGEQLRITSDLVEWFNQMPDCSLHNHYGPSESHVVTAYRLSGKPDTWPLLPPIGKALPHVRIHILDNDLRPVSPGEVGELYIGGDCLAREYLHRSDLTSERFVYDPLGSGRLYKSGDLARCLTGGVYEYLGRCDQQIKLRGYRIEPGEVETVIEQHPDVSEAVVIAREDNPGQKRLVAYVVAPSLTMQSGTSLSTTQRDLTKNLHQLVQSTLPSYMTPSIFLVLDAFPLTPSGKIDRRNLPMPACSVRSKFCPPRTDIEKMLAGIWENVLGMEKVGINDNFFELGGDSLLATQVITRIRDAHCQEVSFSQFFETPKLETFAVWLSSASAPRLSQPIPLVRAVHHENLPLTKMQEPLWVLDQLVEGHPFYTVPEAFSLQGSLCVQALARSLQAVVDRHETLRTTFEEITGRPVQIVHEEAVCPFLMIDLSSLPASEREHEAKAELLAAARAHFDLTRDVLLRATVFKMRENDHIMLLSLHHIVCDGWSIGVLMRELQQLYKAYEAGNRSPLPPIPLQYRDFTRWHRTRLSSEIYEQQLAYWRQHLGNGVPKLMLPTDFPRPAIPTYDGGREFFKLSKSLTDRLKKLSKGSGTTLFMVLLTAFQTLLHRYSSQEDFAVGALIANRPHSDLETLIGFFPNTLVMRGDLSGDPSFLDVLDRVREVTLGAFAHQDLPFDQLVQVLHPDHEPGQNPFFQVLFNLQNTPVSDWELPSLSLTRLNLDNKTAKFDLFLELSESESGMEGYFEYSSDLFKAETIERMSGHFLTLVRSITAHPDWSISKLSLFNESEKQQLASWNKMKSDYPRDRCLHELIEFQSEETPDAIALTFQTQQVSYQVLNHRANQCARYFQTLGVRRGILVGVFLERSPELVVALLAILKAGGAYVPLDPIYPEKRVALMVEDSGLSLLITQSSLRPQALSSDVQVICLDLDETLTTNQSSRNLESVNTPDDLAYTIYTSGSTGRPKGVQIQHAALVNFLWSMRHTPGLSSTDVLVAVTTICFDIAGLELFLPLITGAQIVLSSRQVANDPQQLAELLANSKATVMQATPATWRMLLATNWSGQPRLKMLCGGEALSRDLADQLLKRGSALWNMYGPTETTIWSTVHQVHPGCTSIPIGRPIANTQVYLLNRVGRGDQSMLQPVPTGIAGELYIGGEGLAKGYLNRPILTQERFVNNPFDPNPKARLYRTGDLARYLPDGTLECLGRIDHQVKIRGFRIELGDIESVLNQHDVVHSAVVVAREGRGHTGNQQLVAYVVANKQALADAAAIPAQTRQWKTIWDETYRGSKEDDPTFDITGWENSYTGKPMPADEMREWVNHTVDRILSHKPDQVLEIGCGTGLLLYRVAPHCLHYKGYDLSETAIQSIQNQILCLHLDCKLQLNVGTADGFPLTDIVEVDTVVINSVVQYFPDVQYLVNVLDRLLGKLKPGSRILLGDLRSLPLLKAFHTSIQLYQAADELPIGELKQRIEAQVTQDSELVIDPVFFEALQKQYPKIGHIDIQLKRGRYHNELSLFRYDVVLHIGPPSVQAEASIYVDWSTEIDITILHQLLSKTQPPTFALKRVTNARLSSILQTTASLNQVAIGAATGLSTVAELRFEIGRQTHTLGMDPEDLWQLGQDLSYDVSITWSQEGDIGEYDVLFRRSDFKILDVHQEQVVKTKKVPSVQAKSWAAYANEPARPSQTTGLVTELRQYLQTELPDYMIPGKFVVLDTFPLTPNGKVDRQALPEPTSEHTQEERNIVAPSTPLEQRIADIWMAVLSLDVVSTGDNFFDLGGHSLLAAELLFRLKEVFEVELSLINIFTSPSVKQQAQLINDRKLDAPVEQPILDLWDEASLPDDIIPDPKIKKVVNDPKAILLTGATGFLGGYLLNEMLEQTKAKIYCLVRAKDIPSATCRLRANLKQFDLWKPQESGRIIPILGDLAKPDLAINAKEWQRLAETIDVVYHNGAMVNFMHPYSVMKATNVLATEAVLRLASQVKLKPVHFVSTLGVFSPVAYTDGQVIREQDEAWQPDGLYGYTQSKWVAEKLLAIAQSRGIPTTIYRPAWIEGHSQTGICNRSDFLRSLVKGCIQLGVAPDWAMPVDFVSVDVISQFIVHYSSKQISGQSFNFANPQAILWNRLVDWLVAYGYRVKRVPYSDWLTLVKSQVKPGSENALAPFLAFLTDQDPQYSMTIPEMYFCTNRMRFETQNLQQGLADMGVSYPPVEALLPTYFDYFMKTGFLDPPSVVLPQNKTETGAKSTKSCKTDARDLQKHNVMERSSERQHKSYLSKLAVASEESWRRA